MGDLMGWDPLKKKKNNIERVSINQAIKFVNESIKILLEMQKKLNMLSGKIFQESDQLQNWYKEEITKLEKWH